MRPTFDAALIAHLKARVVEHNEAHPGAKTKLGDLRKIYERNFRRANPGVRALQKVEQHLDELSKGGTFEEDEHPRGHGGEFTSKGRAPAPPAAPSAATRTMQDHKALQASDAGYRAMTSDVIPDNRHEAAGAMIRDGVSVGGTAAAIGALAASKRNGRLARAAGDLGAYAVGGKRFSKLGRKAGEATVNGLSAGVKSLLRVQSGSRLATAARKAGAFGVLSLAGGVALRSQWKDSFLDPAAAGRIMDAYSYRTIQKAAASDELGIARVELTQALAKQAGPVGGSVEGLRAWLEQGGGEMSEVGELTKGVPWGKAAVRLFSAVAGAGGSTVGAALGYGAAKITEPPVPDDADFETKHPRDEHGRFSVKASTGRTHRFVQIGGLLGGAAAAIATHRALTRYTDRVNLANHVGLREAYAEAIRKTQAFEGGRAGAALRSSPKRVESLISQEGTDPRFNAHRKLLADIDAMDPSNEGAIQDKVRKAYHEHLARQFSAYPDMEIPTRAGGWTRLSQATAGTPKIGKATAAEGEMMAALTRIHEHEDSSGVWKEMLDRMVGKKLISAKQAKSFSDIRREAQTAVASVPGNMKGHKQKVAEAAKELAEAKKVTEAAKARLDLAVTDVKLRGPTLDDAGKAGLEAAAKVAEAEHATAKAASEKAAKFATDLVNNPVGVIHPIHKEPILPPTVAEISKTQAVQRDAAMAAARTKATKIIEAENEQIRDRQVGRLQRGFDRRQLVMAIDMARSNVPKRSRAALGHLTRLTEKAKVTKKALAEAELTHLPNRQRLELLEAVSKPTRSKTGQAGFAKVKGVSESEAEATRLRGPEIRADFDKTKAAVDAAEAAHVAAVGERDGALAAYNETMKELPPKPARQWIDPALRADIDRMRGEIGALAGSYVKSPSGAKLKALYDKIAEDTARHGKAGVAQGKKLGIKALKDLFTRDDPSSPEGYRIDAGKILTNLSFGTALATAAKADIITHAQRWVGPEETRRAADKRELNIKPKQEILDGLNGRGYWTLNMKDPANPNDRVVLVGHTFENARGPTSPITTGVSLSSLKAAIADREERRKKAAQNGNGGGQPGQGEDRQMPKMSDEDRKAARAGVAALHNKQAIDSIRTFDGGPTIQVRKEGFNPGDDERDLKATLSRAEQAVTSTLKEKHGLKDASPGGEAYHSALSALFSDEAKTQRRNRKYMFLTGYTEDGQKAGNNASILKPNAGYGGSSAEALSALSAELDRVATSNAPTSRGQALNLVRAVGLVAAVKKIGAAETVPLYNKIGSAIRSPGAAPSAPSPGAPHPAAAAPAAPASTAMTEAAKPTSPPIDIDLDKPTSASTRRRWNTDAAYRAAHELSEDVSTALGITNPIFAEHMPLVMAGMAEGLHDIEPGFTETEAVGEINTALHAMAGNTKLRSNVRQILLNSEHRDPGAALWNYLKPAITARIERKRRDMGKLADHPLDDVEQLVKISMGSFIESLHPRAAAGSAAGGEFVAEGAGGGHGAGVSTKARIAGEAAEAGTMAARKLTGGNGGGGGTLPGEGGIRPKPAQAWYNPTRFGNEFGAALGFDTALSAAHALLPEARLLEDGAGIVARSAYRAKGLARGGAGLVAGSIGAEVGSDGGEAAGSGAIRLATGRKAAEYQAPESHGMDSLLANSAGATVGGIVGTGIGRGVGAFAGRAIGGALGSVAGPVGAVVGGAALGYAGGKISEGIYDYFAGYDQPAVKRALARVGAGKGTVRP